MPGRLYHEIEAGYNLAVPAFKFYHPVEIRYGDLDPQGHVNNARYLTYLEQGRLAYIMHLGLWRGDGLMSTGFVLADAHLAFRRPILFGQSVRVGVRVTRLGNKSLAMAYHIEDAATGEEYATAETVQVAYDYNSGQTIPIPANWREAVAAFEGLEQPDAISQPPVGT